MDQSQLIILLFKIALIADAIAIVVFIVDYTRLAPWWRTPIGKTIVIKDCLLFIPIFLGVLSAFWHFNRLTSHISAWITVVSFGMIAPVMLWRTAVFERVHHQDKDDPAAPQHEGEES